MDGGSRLLSLHAQPTAALLGGLAILWLALALLAVVAATLGLDLGPAPDSHLLLSPTRWPAPDATLA
jgi:hypothetical protein